MNGRSYAGTGLPLAFPQRAKRSYRPGSCGGRYQTDRQPGAWQYTAI
jgi:hypothetical protein